MRIVIDFQGAQSPGSGKRGIGRYTWALTKAIIRNSGAHEVVIALSDLLPETIEPIRQDLATLLPPDNIRVWAALESVAHARKSDDWRRQAAELTRETFLASLDPDVVLVTSLFEGIAEDVVTSIGKIANGPLTAVILYDLIPFIDRESYLRSPEDEAYYFEKIEHLCKADLWLAISDSSRQEGLTYLQLPENRCVSVSTDADAKFMPVEIPQDREQAVRTRYGLNRPFVLYTGGGDARKNIDKLILAFAGLPKGVRKNYKLAIIGHIQPADRERLNRLGRRAGLTGEDLIFGEFVSDDDLLALYNLCELFVLPSSHEGFGLPALEAMRCGAPVIGANVSSIPEVIRLDEALFDPHSVQAISEAIQRGLTDEVHRERLMENGRVQAKRFSWDSSAQKAISAMERLVDERPKTRVQAPGVKTEWPRLAYVSPLPAEPSEFADYSAELLRSLSHYYQIDVIVDQGEISDPRIRQNYPVHSSDWLYDNAHVYDRVLYHFGNSVFHRYMFDLLPQVLGIVVLHDFFLSEEMEIQQTAPRFRRHELYRAHGYGALVSRSGAMGPGAVIQDYPCNQSVIHHSLGMITPSPLTLDMARKWYGDDAEQWVVIPGEPDLQKHAMQYRDAIEGFYRRAATGWRSLPQAIAALPPPHSNEDLIGLADALGRTFPARPRQKQLLVDISVLVEYDAKTGIQRVVRNLLKQWLNNPPADFRIEPVYVSHHASHYRYARKFTSGFMGLPADLFEGEEDALIEFAPGDIFLGLDLGMHYFDSQKKLHQQMRRYGVKTFFIVYDLLPVQMPQHFPPGASEAFANWLLTIVAVNNGAICISQAVADDLAGWISKNAPERREHLSITSFHLGADLDLSSGSAGLPEDAESVLQRLAAVPSFLMVGTVEPRKGHVQTLAAFEKLWEEGADINLVIAGKAGWALEGLWERLRRHPRLGVNLFWLQGISDEYLERIYAAADCLIAASEGEGFGLPLIEAARHRLPILARGLPVFREVAGDHAAYFSGMKPADLAEAITDWLTLFKQDRHPKSDNMPWISWQGSASQLMQAILRISQWSPPNPSL